MARQTKTETKINYRALRHSLLRACLRTLLSALRAPTEERRQTWKDAHRDYRDLTGDEAVSMWLNFTLDEFRLLGEDRHYIRERWLRLLDTVARADEELGRRSAYYRKFYAVSPFKNLRLVHIDGHGGPSGQARNDALVQKRVAASKPMERLIFRQEVGRDIYLGFGKRKKPSPTGPITVTVRDRNLPMRPHAAA